MAMENPPMAQLPMVVLVDCLRVSSAGPVGRTISPQIHPLFLVMKYEELSRLAGFAVSHTSAVQPKRHLALAIPPGERKMRSQRKIDEGRIGQLVEREVSA
jgi:hypothetical protein